MAVAVGPALRIEPHRSASIAGEYTALAELVCPAASFRLVAVVTATALLGTEPAMGTIRLWDQTYKGFSQVRIYGTQTVVIHIPTVSVGDLVQVTASPWLDDGGYWAGARVWIQKVEITLVDFADVEATPSTWAPPLWPTQLSATDAVSSTTLAYSLGDGWGLAATSTEWRFRPVGSDDWLSITSGTSGTVVLPFDLVDSAVAWEVSGRQSTDAGTSEWGPIVVWSAPGTALVWSLSTVNVGSQVWISGDGVEAAIHPAHVPFLADGAALVRSSDYDNFTVARTDEVDFAVGGIVWEMCLTTDWSALGPVTPEVNDWNVLTGLVGPKYVNAADGWAWYDYALNPIPDTSEFTPATAGLSGWMKGWLRLTKNTSTGVFTMEGSANGTTWTALGGGTHVASATIGMGSGIIFGTSSPSVVTVDKPTYYLHSLNIVGGTRTLTFTEADIVAATPAAYTLGNAAQFPEPWTVATGVKVFQGATAWVPAEYCPVWVDGVAPVWTASSPTLTNPKIIWSPAANPALMSELSGQPNSAVPARGWVWEIRDDGAAPPVSGGGGYGADYGNDYGGT